MMEFPCPRCGENVAVRSSDHGGKVTCPGCDAIIIVPGRSLLQKMLAPLEHAARDAGSKWGFKHKSFWSNSAFFQKQILWQRIFVTSLLIALTCAYFLMKLSHVGPKDEHMEFVAAILIGALVAAFGSKVVHSTICYRHQGIMRKYYIGPIDTKSYVYYLIILLVLVAAMFFSEDVIGLFIN